MGRMGGGPQGGEATHCVKVGKLNLVDLAGSERVHITGATGARPMQLHTVQPHPRHERQKQHADPFDEDILPQSPSMSRSCTPHSRHAAHNHHESPRYVISTSHIATHASPEYAATFNIDGTW